jgi:LPS-assembly lipoprotein
LRLHIQLLALLVAAVLLAGCSFHLRGQATMPFQTLYLKATNPGTPFIKELSRNLKANNVKLVDTAAKADVVLDIVSEIPDKQILSLSGNGRVNEYQLFYRVSLRAYDHDQHDVIPAEEIVMQNDFPYDDSNVIAMESQETLLYQNLRSDIVQRIVNRLSRVKLKPH